MQTLQEIRELLDQVAARPNKRFGQCFMVDKNLLAKVIDLAEIDASQTVLEVGPGTGTLTEELLVRAGRVVAVEIDRALQELLAQRLGQQENFHLIRGDVLASKHAMAGEVIESLLPEAQLVANLPYSIATPLVAECVVQAWKAFCDQQDQCVRFTRLTFTVQKEVADRMDATVGSSDYGPISILMQLMGRFTPGPVLPPGAFWPAPKVQSRAIRFDFDPEMARQVKSVEMLQRMLALSFQQRRKQILSVAKRRDFPFDPQLYTTVLREAGIDTSLRPQQISPQQFCDLANLLSQGQ